MSKIDTDVLHAFVSLGVAPEIAESAAAAISKRDDELLDVKMTLSAHTATLSLLTWMIGVNVAISLAILGKIILH